MTVTKEPYYVPEPKDDVDKPKAGDRMSPADKMRKAYYEGLEIESFRRAAGLDSKGKDEESSTVQQMLVTTMQSYSSALSNLVSELTKAASIAQGARAPEQGEFLKYLITEVQTMKQKMEGGQGDPFALIDEYHARMTKWQDEMQKRLGVGTSTSVPSAASGIEALRLNLEIEKMRLESAERQRQHEADLAERRHRWEQEDKRWNAEFNLKLQELGFHQKQSEQTTATFQDLLGSLVESIEPSTEPVTNAGKPVAQQPARVEPPPASEVKHVFPKSYVCDQCRDAFAWPADQMTAACPHCGTQYELEPVK